MRHLHMLRKFHANIIWIVTFWLQCHISIFIAIIKLKTFYRWSEVRFAGFEMCVTTVSFPSIVR